MLQPPYTGQFEDGLWLGANDFAQVGTFVWQNSHAALNYTNWDQGQPSLVDPAMIKENCLHMWLDIGKWNDLNCDVTYVPQATICEVLYGC